MAGYDGAGSLFALGVRVTKLAADGSPLPGVANCYTTESLVTIGLGNTYSEPDAIELQNGSGITCVYYAPPKTLQGGTIEEFKICTPDPAILQFCCGGDLITTGGTDEIQTITITGTPTGGTFTLTFSGQTTAAIAYNAAATAVQSALIALPNVSAGDVTVSGGPGPTTAWVATFAGQYADQDVPAMTATSSLTGGTTPAVAVTTTTGGVLGANVIGYRAPQVNVDPTPNGVAVEAWSRAVLDNSFAGTLPYFHWVMPRAKIVPSEAVLLGAEDPATPVFEGVLEQNPGFGLGPVGDLSFPADRIYQYARVATVPDLSVGFVEVVAP